MGKSSTYNSVAPSGERKGPGAVAGSNRVHSHSPGKLRNTNMASGGFSVGAKSSPKGMKMDREGQ